MLINTNPVGRYTSEPSLVLPFETKIARGPVHRQLIGKIGDALYRSASISKNGTINIFERMYNDEQMSHWGVRHELC